MGIEIAHAVVVLLRSCMEIPQATPLSKNGILILVALVILPS